jgi:hypothetical protein
VLAVKTANGDSLPVIIVKIKNKNKIICVLDLSHQFTDKKFNKSITLSCTGLHTVSKDLQILLNITTDAGRMFHITKTYANTN